MVGVRSAFMSGMWFRFYDAWHPQKQTENVYPQLHCWLLTLFYVETFKLFVAGAAHTHKVTPISVRTREAEVCRLWTDFMDFKLHLFTATLSLNHLRMIFFWTFVYAPLLLSQTCGIYSERTRHPVECPFERFYTILSFGILFSPLIEAKVLRFNALDCSAFFLFVNNISLYSNFTPLNWLFRQKYIFISGTLWNCTSTECFHISVGNVNETIAATIEHID